MYQLEIRCLREEVDQLSHQLEQAGALSITLSDQYDDAILEPELGTTPLWPHVVIQALLEEQNTAEQIIQQLSTSQAHLEPTLSKIDDTDWEHASRDHFKPLCFGDRFWVCPSWITPPVPTAINLLFDPGLAFGTGTHPTTALCLSWLEQANLQGLDVIDYGCGSGILALAALKLGALSASAVDIDEQALIATQHNAQTNHIRTDQLQITTPDNLQASADVLIANILLSPLVTLKKRFHQLLKPNGCLITSGILAEQVAALKKAYESHFTHQSTQLKDDWALVTFSPIAS